MRLIFVLLFCSFIAIMGGKAQSPSYRTYVNPVIPGDHPDPTVTRIGNDYYTTGSSFNPTPRIFHSTDLVHWEVVAQPVPADWKDYGDDPMWGAWGGHLVFYNGKFWHFFGHWYTMCFVTADRVEGPWSEPVAIKKPYPLPSNPFDYGQDNSVFIDDDNKMYMLTKADKPNAWIIELGPDGQPPVGGACIDLRWLNPCVNNANNKREHRYGWAEGPVMHKHNGYYYYYVSKSAAATQYVFRTPELTADSTKWEFLGELYDIKENNNSIFPYPAHYSTPVQIQDGTWWAISHSYGYKWDGQGRQGILNQVYWDDKGKPKTDFPNNKPFVAPNLPSSGIPWMVPKSDFFIDTKLNPEWSFLGKTLKINWSLTERPGWFMLMPKPGRLSTLIKQDAEKNYALITKVEFNAAGADTVNQAGLHIIDGLELFHVKVFLSNRAGQNVIGFASDSIYKGRSVKNLYYSEVKNTIGNTVWLKLERNGHFISGYYSATGSDWNKIGDDYNLEVGDIDLGLTPLTGNYQGLFVQGDATNKAFFDLYVYRDAYTAIPADYPANWFGTSRTELSPVFAVLDSIDHNDWAMFAGVEFGTDSYKRSAVKFEASASSIGSGGNIEIWLDSIGTGTKIGTCKISATGSHESFTAFSCNIAKTTGRHDVFLRFTGPKGATLFRLKSIKFRSKK